jgi:hypothetical protein
LPEKIEDDYTDSDFGDNVSLASIHGWSDDEDGASASEQATV